MKKPTPGQLDKYDIDQKIIKTLADLESRTILLRRREGIQLRL